MTDDEAASSESRKRPASQYYWGDWHKDLALQSCPLAARGLWHEMNCLMHQGEPYGHLTMPNGKPMTPAQLANLTKIPERECKRLLGLLEESGVFSRTDDGAIFSRRMVRDEAVRNQRANGGQLGAEHGEKGASYGAKGGRPRKQTGDKKPPLEPPPSSSSSSSTSVLPPNPPQGARVFHPRKAEDVVSTTVPSREAEDTAASLRQQAEHRKLVEADRLERLRRKAAVA